MNPLEEEEESWPNEPDEFDPDSLGPDPPDSTRTLRESLGATEDVSDGLFRAFWASVLLLNVAIAALSIGAMFVYFRGDVGTGVPLMGIGVVAAAATGRYYWRFKTGTYTQDAPNDDTDVSNNGDDASVDEGERFAGTDERNKKATEGTERTDEGPR